MSPKAQLTFWTVLVASTIVVQSSASAPSSAAKVVITGGPDATGQAYTWVVANLYDSPIVGVEIPHFRGDLFTAPGGWSTDCTNLVGVGFADEPGVCTASADSTSYAVTKPQTATFQLQLAARGTKPGTGEVLVHFADGTDALIERVILPVRESFVEKFSSVLGLALIGALVITIGGRRKRRSSQTAKS